MTVLAAGAMSVYLYRGAHRLQPGAGFAAGEGPARSTKLLFVYALGVAGAAV